MRAEPWLGRLEETTRILQKYGFRFQKKYGQNFLVNGGVLDRIVEAAGVTGEDCVIEIGPGIGTLTQYLAHAAFHVYSVEIDRNLLPILEDTLSDWDNVTVIHQDILKMDLPAFLEENCRGRRVKVVANLPYYITTPILMELLEQKLPVDSITVMVQREVADRMQAEAGSKDYGALSLAVQYFSEPHIAVHVPAGSFIPRPKVGSAVIHLACGRSRTEGLIRSQEEEKLLFRVIRASFSQRRKTLYNGLKNAESLSFSKEEIEAAIARCGFLPAIRGEKLSLEDFCRLTRELAAGSKN